MRFEDLSPEDQAIVRTDFGPELEKAASDKVALAQEMYQRGYEMGLELAQDMAKQASEDEKKDEDKDKDEDKLDEESEKNAAELGALIARGAIDALLEKGAEAGDPHLFLQPWIEEKVAEAGAVAALRRFGAAAGKRLKDLKDDTHIRGLYAADKAKGAFNKAKGAVGSYHKGMAEDARLARTGMKAHVGAHGGKRDLHVSTKDRASAAGRAAAKALPHAAAAGAVGAGVHAALRKKDND